MTIAGLALVVAAFFRAGRTTASSNARVVTALIVVAGGCVFLLIAVFLSKDPQGGIAVLFSSAYQGIAILVLLASWALLALLASFLPLRRAIRVHSAVLLRAE